MCVVSIIIPDEHFSEQVMYVLFWGGASAITLGAIYYYGQEFVDRPKLVQAKLKSEWNEVNASFGSARDQWNDVFNV